MIKIAILASGAGSNAKNIIEYFANSTNVSVALIASNKREAGVLDIAAANHIETYHLTRNNFIESGAFLDFLVERSIDFIVLAGFLWKVPSFMVEKFPKRIINIHPALLPAYGGKGMYGHFVHESVYVNQESESGITIHFVNENYDEGDIIFQAKVPLDKTDTPDTIESKVRALEMLYFPKKLEEVFSKHESKNLE